ncbi:MAG: hypothetical protein K2P68_07380 [Sphingomonas sp.]|nr:hypothetical protein [Sphingomonas sp.]
MSGLKGFRSNARRIAENAGAQMTRRVCKRSAFLPNLGIWASKMRCGGIASVDANAHHHFALERYIVDRQTCNERRSIVLAEWQSLAS